MRYAIIEKDIVTNIALAEAPLADNWIPANDGKIGDTWDGQNFITPVVDDPVPTVVTPRQAKIALLQEGLLDDVEAGIEALEDPTLKRLAQIEWEYAQEVRRDWPLLNQLAAGMGITDGQLDDLFRVAAGI